MKKFAFLAIALLGLSLTACNGKKAETPTATDSAQVEAPADSSVSAEAAALTSQLATQLESGDATAVQATVQKAQVYLGELAAKGDTAQLRQYAEQFSAFVAQHKDKIEALTKNNPQVGALINSVATSPDKLMNVANTALKALGAQGADAAKAAEAATKTAAQGAEAAAQNAVNQANAKVNEAANKAVEKTNAATEKAAEKANDAVNKAKDALKF